MLFCKYMWPPDGSIVQDMINYLKVNGIWIVYLKINIDIYIGTSGNNICPQIYRIFQTPKATLIHTNMQARMAPFHPVYVRGGGCGRLWPLKPATRILLRVLFHCWRFRYLSSAQCRSAGYGLTVVFKRNRYSILTRHNLSAQNVWRLSLPSFKQEGFVSKKMDWTCCTYVCCVTKRHRNRGGKKHPLMIKLKSSFGYIKSIWKFRCKHDNWTLLLYTK